jgi:hypothetical protein
MSVKSFKTSGIKVDLAPQGLVLLNTTSFSAVSSVSAPTGTFNSTYDSYRLVLYATHSINSVANIRFRTSGSDNTNSNYQKFGVFAGFSSAVSRLNVSGANTLDLFGNNSNETLVDVDIFNPNQVNKTRMNGFWWSASTGDSYAGTLTFDANTVFDSISFFPGSGTVTGRLLIYGYNQ